MGLVQVMIFGFAIFLPILCCYLEVLYRRFIKRRQERKERQRKQITQ